MKSRAVDLFGNTLNSLLKSKEHGEVLSKQDPPSIYMVPSVIRDLSPSSFTPKVVAIGPLHRHDEHLQGFEIQKTTYLHNWFHGFVMEPEQTLRECLQKVIHSIESIKACYAGSMIYSDFELAKMMVIDACFILMFIRTLWGSSPSFQTNDLITRSIVYDLLLIENQIPFFVLENIFECTSGRLREGFSLARHLYELLRYYYYFDGNLVERGASAPDHILGLFHQYLRPAGPVPPVSMSSIKRHSAMELDRAGMNFKPHTEDQNWTLAMKLELPLPLFPWFHKFMPIPSFPWFRPPTLRMPKVHIHDGSELIFRNLVVYEQAFGVEKYVTSYLTAMDMLIDTPEDLALLVKSKVLESGFGSNEEAADMINSLCKNISFPQFFYHRGEWDEMDVYYNRHWPHFIAGLKRTYFNNPWSFIALVAAFILFAVTITQAIFTVKAA